MKKEVLISITGLQHEIDQEEAVKVSALGTYYEKNGKTYILYDENSADSGKTTKNTIKIGKEQIDIIKRGENNVHMVFQPGKQKVSYYNTPIGELLVEINTTCLDIQEQNADNTDIKIVYDLKVNGTHISECIIKMNISSKETKRI